jgi:hypothetical protein
MAAVLLAAVVAGAGTTAAAVAQGDGHQVRYCRTVDAYRIRSCARAVLPASPVGRQLGWVLAQLGGEAASLTEAEVRQHVSAEFLTVVMSAQEVIGALQATLAEQASWTSSASPTRPDSARRWRSWRTPPATGARSRSVSPPPSRP